jgi:hypothetical protein
MTPRIKIVALLVALSATPLVSAVSEAADDRPDHIVMVIQENHGFSKIIGNPKASFINRLATEGLLFAKYHGVGRPSQVNYFALFSGSTHGITDNDKNTIAAPTLADQLENAGLSFVGYAETGAERKHTPWESFVGPRHRAKDFRTFPGNFNNLPTVAFVTPSLSHNMHDGSIEEGDRWLRKYFERYVKWAKDHNSLFILTFDENDGNDDCRVATIVVGAGIKPGTDSTIGNHYSLLRAIQSIYGLGPLAGNTAAPLFAVTPAKIQQREVLSRK